MKIAASNSNRTAHNNTNGQPVARRQEARRSGLPENALHRANESQQARRTRQVQKLADKRSRTQPVAQLKVQLDQSAVMQVQKKTIDGLSSEFHGPSAFTGIVQREPTAASLPPSKKWLYHVTKIENFHSMVARGGLMPLNWIIEGTHGQRADDSSKNRGLDAHRGKSELTSAEEHARTVAAARKTWIDARGTEFADVVAKHYADIKLGRKRDFVYGTRKGSGLAFYRDFYTTGRVSLANLVVLRWVQHGEAYYPDIEDSNAIKTLESIPLNRLEVAPAIGIGDGSPEELEKLGWRAADNLPGLVAANLLPPSPATPKTAVSPEADEAEEIPLPSIEELEALIGLEQQTGDDRMAELQALIALDEQAADDEIAALERSIAEDAVDEDRIIADIEAELGPEAVAEIELQVRRDLADELLEEQRIMALVDEAMRQAAPHLHEAANIEARLQTVTEEIQELIAEENAIAERLATPL